MGRGYAYNRSASARVTEKQKRLRSVSAPVHFSKLAEQAEHSSNSDDDGGVSEAEDETIVNPAVLTKYKHAGRIVDAVIDLVCAACVSGASTMTLCELGDRELDSRCQSIFRKAKDDAGNKLKRGIAYPTNVSVNSTLCNHSPMSSTEEIVLKDGDVVKVHLGAHLDGYSASAARTIIVGCDTTAQVVVAEPTLRCIRAAAAAMDCMMRMMHPGIQNTAITNIIAAVGQHFAVQPLEGVLSTRMKRYVPDSLQAIIARRIVTEEPQQDVAPCTMSVGQVWNLDVAFTTAQSYKTRVDDDACNIFRRNEIEESVRLNAAHELCNEIRQSSMCFPFNVRNTKNALRAKLGIVALKKASMVDAYPQLSCQAKHVAARFSCCVAITATRANLLCGGVVLPAGSVVEWPPLPPESTEVATILASPWAHPAAAVEQAVGSRGGKQRMVEMGADEPTDEENTDEVVPTADDVAATAVRKSAASLLRVPRPATVRSESRSKKRRRTEKSC